MVHPVFLLSRWNGQNSCQEPLRLLPIGGLKVNGNAPQRQIAQSLGRVAVALVSCVKAGARFLLVPLVALDQGFVREGRGVARGMDCVAVALGFVREGLLLMLCEALLKIWSQQLDCLRGGVQVAQSLGRVAVAVGFAREGRCALFASASCCCGSWFCA